MGTGIEVEWSQKGILSVASGGSVYVSDLALFCWWRQRDPPGVSL